ncbi:hypothetical protein E1161_13410 [Saccharopolyspora aridisoli]|uniref:Terminase small subunit n=1 Tax=Saccharopolyspora aridisoli TaxID=2530385 RepID=A0A4V2Y7J6_9PSEU|nr:hypothetical protein [Saccharopolyspora aridisoli]TDC92365.1 hypothetical protein E1161_13410 [Saccharopolyspora aridisoli]
MGTRGPVPKRSEQRIRRNRTDQPTESVTELGAVSAPDLGLDDPHPLVAEWYRALTESAQSRYFEPSDWQTARFVAHTMDRYVRSSKPSSQMFAALMSAMSDLLVTEGARRRARIEIERGQVEERASVSALAEYRRSLGV